MTTVLQSGVCVDDDGDNDVDQFPFMLFAQNMTQIHGQHLPSVKFALKKLLFVTRLLN